MCNTLLTQYINFIHELPMQLRFVDVHQSADPKNPLLAINKKVNLFTSLHVMKNLQCCLNKTATEPTL